MSGRSGRPASRRDPERDPGRDPEREDGAHPAPPSLAHATALAVCGRALGADGFGADGLGADGLGETDAGVLLRGPSGAGKSDLAFRMIEAGAARLIADDRTAVVAGPDGPVLIAPPRLAGRIEVRGLGIVTLPAGRRAASARLRLIVDLVPRAAVPRLPEPLRETALGVPIPLVRLHAFDASTPAKIRRALALIAAREGGADDQDDADADGIGPACFRSAS